MTIKKIKPQNPCPLCGHEMSGKLEIHSLPLDGKGGVNLYGYAEVTVKFSCRNDLCRYEERTKGKSEEPETIKSLLDVIMSYAGPKLFKRGKFQVGNVGVNRRRHTGIYRFEPVEPEEIKGEKR